MTLKRMFTTVHVKGTQNYIDSQKKYEILRTLIYFILPLGLFLIGYITTKSKTNLLTVVAVVGCLPACKSLIGVIMFLKHKSMSQANCEKINAVGVNLPQLYDMVFTTYDKTHVVSHMVLAGNTVCGFSEQPNFKEKDFQQHIQNVLHTDGYKNVSIKIFTDVDKYVERMKQMENLEVEEKVNVLGIMDTMRSVAL